MALVGCAMAQDGNIMSPYIVDGVYNANGERSFEASPIRFAQAISPTVANKVLECMKGVVDHGTATDAQIPGYSIAGKTGTAEKEGRPNDSWFVGVGNADGEANVVVAIMVEGAGDDVHAAGLSRGIMEAALEVVG